MEYQRKELKDKVGETNEIYEKYRNTIWNGLVNYSCWPPNSATPPKTIETSADPQSLASLIMNNRLIEIKELKEEKSLVKITYEKISLN